MDNNEEIAEFSGEYRFLSNFYAVPDGIRLGKLKFPTVEHAYQAAKTLDDTDRLKICSCPSPNEAKRIGRKVKLREDWEYIKLIVMEVLLRQKFKDELFYAALIKTYPKKLIEGNYWGDCFWGVCFGEGENHLGKLLMKIRKELMEK